MTSPLVVTDTTVLVGDAAATVREHVDVAVADGHITAIGPALARSPDARVIDGRALVLMPGLVNGHTHSTETLAKGRDDRSTLMGWFQSVWPYLDTLTPRQIEVAVLLGAVEMIRTGSTAVVDHFRRMPLDEAAIDAAVRGWTLSGMRAIVAPMVRDRNLPGGPGQPDGAAQVALVADAARRVAGNPRVRIALGPSAPNRCSDALLGAVRDASERHGLLVHTHVDEIRDEARAARAEYGHSIVRHLDHLGLVSPTLSIAHAVWIDDDDVATLARGGANVVHNPLANMRLGSGIAPVTALRRAGVPVAIASDGAASNDGQDVLEAVKAATFLQRVTDAPQSEWLDAPTALGMAARIPAGFYGFGSGLLEAGAPADFVGLAADGYAFAPVHDWHRQIVLCASGVEVALSVVGGTVLLADGRITAFDERALLAEARAIADSVFRSLPDTPR